MPVRSQVKLPLAAALAVALVAGCSSTPIRKTEADIDATAIEAAALLAKAKAGASADSSLSVIDGDYVPAKPRAVLESEKKLPVPCVTEWMRAPASIIEFAQQITKDCNIRVRVTPDALAHVSGGLDGSSDATASQAPAAPTPIALPSGVTLPAPVGGGGGMPGVGVGGATNLVDVTYATGPVEPLLDAATARLGLAWKYAGGAIQIHYMDTRIYRLYNIPDATKMDSTVSSGVQSALGATGGTAGSTGASGGVSGNVGSSQTTTVNIDRTPLADLENSVKALLSKGGTAKVTNSTGGMLVVRDTPEVLDQVTLFVDDYNSQASKQVVFNVKILAVRTSRSNEMGINWNLAYEDLANSFGVKLANAFSASDEATKGTINILEGSRWNTSQLIVNALAKQGDVSLVKEVPVTALNYEAVPVQVADQTSYLAQVQQTNTSDVGSSTALQPGSVTVGFNLHLLPQIQPDGKTIVLRYSINQAELNQIRRVESGDNAIEMPDVSMTIFSQKVRIRAGQTLVVSGFDDVSKTADRNGVGSPKFWLLGGGSKSQRQHESFVVLITPVVMSDEA